MIVTLGAGERSRAAALFRGLTGVAAVDELDGDRLGLTPASPAAGPASAPDDLAEQVFRAAAAAGLTLRELRREASSLEAIFARITTGRGDGPDA